MKKHKKFLYERWGKWSDEFLNNHPKFPLYFSIIALITVLIKEFHF